MQFRILGPLAAVDDDGQPIPLGPRQQRWLLAVLVLQANEIVSMDRILDAVWGEEPPPTAEKTVQVYVSRLRRLLPEPRDERATGRIETTAAGYILRIGPDELDAWAADVATRPVVGEPPARTARRLRDALEMWRGPALADFAYEAFAETEARRLEELRVRATEACLAAEVEFRGAEVIGELERFVAEQPLRESAVALLLTALARNGRAAQALTVYDAHRRRMADELETEPAEELTRLVARLRAGRGELPDEAAKRSTLPIERTSFIGRQAEIAVILALLAENRLVTMVGAGGVGKSRLALRVAAIREPLEPDGAWFVQLAAVRDPAKVALLIADVLGFEERIGRPAVETLEDRLRDARALIVLDNCEHLVEGVADVVDRLIGTCPGVTILATSREPLSVTGEHLWRVPSLATPTDETPASVATSEAGALFAERARAVSREVDIVGASPAVAKITRRLDGIPLAIELAAAHIGMLTPDEIADRLDDRFKLLTKGPQTGLERHRTLEATTQWSFDLLTHEEQQVLLRLSAFVGDFDLAAAEEVVSDAEVPQAQVLAIIDRLVSKSLVEALPTGAATRYRLLETIREFGRGRLGTELDGWLTRHREYYRTIAERLASQIRSGRSDLYQALNAEFANVRAAVRGALTDGDAETALRIASALTMPMIIGGRFNEQRDWIGAALTAAAHAGVTPGVRAAGVVSAGAIATIDGRWHEGRQLLLEGLERHTAANDVEGRMWDLHWLATNDAELGLAAEAEQHAVEARRLAESFDDPPALTSIMLIEAEVLVAAITLWGAAPATRLEEAGEIYERALAVAERHGFAVARARAIHGLAIVNAETRGPATAIELCRRSVEAWRPFGHGNRLILALISAARIALRADEGQLAIEWLREGLELEREMAWAGPLRLALETAAALDVDRERAALLLALADRHQHTHRWYVPLDVEPIRSGLDAAERADLAKRAEGFDFEASIGLAMEAVAASH